MKILKNLIIKRLWYSTDKIVVMGQDLLREENVVFRFISLKYNQRECKNNKYDFLNIHFVLYTVRICMSTALLVPKPISDRH